MSASPTVLLAFGADDLVENEWVVNGLTVALIIVMTAICVIGTELSAHFQDVLIIAQVLALLAFAVIALYGGASNGTSDAGRRPPRSSPGSTRSAPAAPR